MALRDDPDASVVAVFKNNARQNPRKTEEAGRPIFDDCEEVELRYPGSKNVGVYPATDFSHWADDPMTGSQVKMTYAERFKRQYQQFKLHATQTKSGTPLAQVPFLTEARRAELRAQNIYTVEALAAVDGQELKNLGMGGRDFKNKAIEYLEESRTNAGSAKMQAELDALKAKNEILEEDLKSLKERETSEGKFAGMPDDQIREYIKTNTGRGVVGQPNRKTLVRMAQDSEPKGNAA
jgi:hypothetical protein